MPTDSARPFHPKIEANGDGCLFVSIQLPALAKVKGSSITDAVSGTEIMAQNIYNFGKIEIIKALQECLFTTYLI